MTGHPPLYQPQQTVTTDMGRGVVDNVLEGQRGEETQYVVYVFALRGTAIFAESELDAG